MHTAILVIAGTAHVANAGPIEPAVSADGTKIIVPYVDEDGARGDPNLTVFVVDRKGTIAKRIPVIDVEKGPVAGGDAAKTKLYADAKPRTMVELTPTNPDDADTHRTFDGLTVDLSKTGTLSLQPKGHAALRRTKPGWRTAPTASQAAAMQDKLAAGEIGCFNAAFIGPVWVDTQQRAAVVSIRFHGNDTCWEPASDFAVFTW